MRPDKIVLADILPRDKNAFDLVRLFAAVAVIFGHSFYIFPTGGYSEPVTQLIQRNYTGTLAVGVFFFLSGILVTRSFALNASPPRFLLMRAFRIYPGAIVCLAVISFVIGPIVTAMPVMDYFASRQVYCYFADHVSLLSTFPIQCWDLPGVFTENRIPSAPNGSLWTLTPEIICYLYVVAFGVLGFIKTRLRILAALVAILMVHSVAPQAVLYFSDVEYSDILKVGLFFMAGVFAYSIRDILPIKTLYALLLIVAATFLQGTLVQEYALYFALFYCVLVISASQPVRRIKLPGDYSYGVYIYGWPIQQTIAHFFPTLTSYPSNLITIPAALLAGYLSWTLVEKPALSFARSVGFRRRAHTTA
ncbi:MAG: acyltransferase [Agrobacterium sp.]|nr:acyltransferase [Agrobacterium sp.]